MAKVRTTIQIVFDYDTETNEYTPISKEIIGENAVKEKVKSTTSKGNTKIDTQDNPGLIREDGKLILSEDAIALLGVEPDERILISYDKFGSGFKPVIGIDEKKGNKLTKSNTVSYRGKSNEELAQYGEKFTLSPGKRNGTFYLEGDKEMDYSIPEGIEVNEEPISDDIISLDLDETKAKQITSFTFNDIDLD